MEASSKSSDNSRESLANKFNALSGTGINHKKAAPS